MTEEHSFGPLPTVLSSIWEVSESAKEEFAQWLEQRGLRTPVSQVVGFGQFLVQPATDVLTSESTSSATYVDLATVGPSLSTLGDGKYLVFFGFVVAAGTNQGLMSISVNGASATDSLSTSTARAVAVTLSGGGANTIVSKYRSPGGTCGFLNRWLLALRYANIK